MRGDARNTIYEIASGTSISQEKTQYKYSIKHHQKYFNVME